jgi:hypothetical protein
MTNAYLTWNNINDDDDHVTLCGIVLYCSFSIFLNFYPTEPGGFKHLYYWAARWILSPQHASKFNSYSFPEMEEATKCNILFEQQSTWEKIIFAL